MRAPIIRFYDWQLYGVRVNKSAMRSFPLFLLILASCVSPVEASLPKGATSFNSATNFRDAKHRLTSITDAVSVRLFKFDADDNLTSVIEGAKSNVWTFDAYDRVSSYTDADGNLIQYRYDANNNLTNLVYPGGKIERSHANHCTTHAKELDAGAASRLMNPSCREGKFAYISLNTPAPCPPRGVVLVNQRRGFASLFHLSTPGSLSVRDAAPKVFASGLRQLLEFYDWRRIAFMSIEPLI